MDAAKKARTMLEIQTRICTEEDIPLLYAGIIANEVYNHFDERVLEGMDLWLNGELTPEFEVDGKSIADYQFATGTSLFGALCLMDLELRDPDSTDCLRWVRGVR